MARRAYADGGAIGEIEYTKRLGDIESQIRGLGDVDLFDVREVADLLGHLGETWAEATDDVRSILAGAIVEQVYVDLETKRIGALRPVPAVASLLASAVLSRANSPWR